MDAGLFAAGLSEWGYRVAGAGVFPILAWLSGVSETASLSADGEQYTAGGIYCADSAGRRHIDFVHEARGDRSGGIFFDFHPLFLFLYSVSIIVAEHLFLYYGFLSGNTTEIP